MAHETVLARETLEYADIKKSDTVFEGTGGEGGLSRQIVSQLGADGTLIVTELDHYLSANLRKSLEDSVCKVYVVRENFRNISSIIRANGISALDVIILDLGLASYHYEESGRGFSFERNEPLLMTLDDSPSTGVTARDAINTWKEDSLRDVFLGLGGERHASEIARAIILARKKRSIETTRDLVEIISEALGPRRGALHPATKVFQALRIAINDEVGALRQVLRDGWDSLRDGGRFVVISFHEGEDREVKIWAKNLVALKQGTLLNKKALAPGKAELKQNRRSRSARLRAVQKFATTIR